MPEDFTIDTFAGLVGDRLEITSDTEPIAVELTEATALGEAPTSAPGRRAPFSLELLGPADPLLPQATYRFDHPALGTFEMFIVPIGRDEAGVRYEAVFT